MDDLILTQGPIAFHHFMMDTKLINAEGPGFKEHITGVTARGFLTWRALTYTLAAVGGFPWETADQTVLAVFVTLPDDVQAEVREYADLALDDIAKYHEHSED